MSRDGRRRLIALYADLAAHTEPECTGACARPMTCCQERYCEIAMDFAAEHWGVELQTTWHRALPLMGPDGCTVAPHLRPICTAHTCDICEYGAKRHRSEEHTSELQSLMRISYAVFRLQQKQNY